MTIWQRRRQSHSSVHWKWTAIYVAIVGNRERESSAQFNYINMNKMKPMKNVWIWMRKKSFADTEHRNRANGSCFAHSDWWTPHTEQCSEAARGGHLSIMHIIAFVWTLMARPCSRTAHICYSPYSIRVYCVRRVRGNCRRSPVSSFSHCSRIIRWFVKPWKFWCDVASCRRLRSNYNIYRYVCTASRLTHSHFIWSEFM